MAKEKTKKGVPNKHLHARIAYLNQAATYLSAISLIQPQNDTYQPTSKDAAGHSILPTREMTAHPPGTLAIDLAHSVANTKPSPGHPSTATFNPPSSGLPLQLNAHLRSIAQKGQIRLSSDLKHAICKVCSSPLIEGATCIRSTENLSKGGRKPWADVSVLKCSACGACKHFPVGAKKQRRRSVREAEKLTATGAIAGAAVDPPANEPMQTEDMTVSEPTRDLQMRLANP